MRYLTDNSPAIKELHHKARQSITQLPTSTEEDRVIKLLALLCIAGDLAIQAGILPWDKDEPLKAVQLAFNLWQNERGVKGANLSKIQVLRTFKVKTLRERHLFKNNAKKENEHETEEFQRYIGWYIHSNGKTEYIFDDDGLHELLEKQIPLSEIVEAFISINALLHDKGKKKTRRTVKGIEKPQYFYCVIAETVYDYLEENEI